MTKIFEDVDGPLGTNTIGVYDSSKTVNLHNDGQPAHFASWLVHLGTVEGYRYPTVNLNVRAVPRLARLVVGIKPGARIDIVNIHQALPDHPSDTISLIIEGVQMKIAPYVWTVTLQCSPFEPWRVIVLAEATGDTGPNIAHLDTSGSTLVAGADTGATSLTVATTAGPVWTQLADDFPFDVAVGGVKVTVTNVTGSTSPQTFTVEPLPRAMNANVPVELWSSPVLGLGIDFFF